jgi:hypothetical protein
MKKNPKNVSDNDELFIEAVKNSLSKREVARKLFCDNHFVDLKIKRLNLNIDHFTNSTGRGKTKYIKYIKQTINFLYIKDVYQNKPRGFRQYFALCDCIKCGKKDCEILICSILRGTTKSCGCLIKDNHVLGANCPNWKGFGEIRGNHWSKIKHNAEKITSFKKKKKEFDITIQYAWELFLKQNRRCALSGLLLDMGKHDVRPTASLDRIDSSKGYIEGNVQWVHKDINLMKQSYSDEYFIKMCKQVSQYQEEQDGIRRKKG